MFQTLLIFGLFYLLFTGVISIVLYIILAYSLYKMAVRQGLENSWIAWIPIAQLYILGKLIRTVQVFDWEIPSAEVILPVAGIIVLIFNHVHFLGGLLSLANYILVLFALNKLYKLYRPEKATLYTVLSIFGVTVPFILLSLKDYDQIS
ncbi:hypothetical protein C1I91_18710 [Clostridium manihotivorum]|uniref:Uncharacterized protein n=2 Tax=Clostridium manihotivorum TaxID=2320868 RepID=A0A3R5UH05_9CLOT|nr:hypothetical protein C1I91_18710 [Clostridium manihotivorum]